jgi:hypothetical protein
VNQDGRGEGGCSSDSVAAVDGNAGAIGQALSECAGQGDRGRAVGDVTVRGWESVEVDSDGPGEWSLLLEAQFGDLCVAQQADEDIHTGDSKAFDRVGKPVPVARARHRGQPTRVRACDDEQGGSHRHLLHRLTLRSCATSFP